MHVGEADRIRVLTLVVHSGRHQALACPSGPLGLGSAGRACLKQLRDERDQVFKSIGTCGKDNDTNPKPGQVLLVSEVLVSCDEDLVVRFLCTKLLSVL